MSSLRSRRAHTVLSLALLYPPLIVGAVTMLIPFVWMVTTSLKTLPEVFAAPLALPTSPRWDNYVEVFRQIAFGRYFLNTLFIALVRTAGVLVTSAMAAYAFSRLHFPGRNALFLLYLGTMMLPAQVTMIPNFVLMRELGWIDTYKALTVPLMFSAFGTFLLRQFFLTIPTELEDAAVVDGCSPLGIFRHVVLPLSGPPLATLAVFNFLGAWNDFMWPLIMTNSERLWVLNVGLSYFQEMYFTNWPLLMAGAVMALLPVMVVYIVAQRYFVESITLTGIKA